MIWKTWHDRTDTEVCWIWNAKPFYRHLKIICRPRRVGNGEVSSDSPQFIGACVYGGSGEKLKGDRYCRRIDFHHSLLKNDTMVSWYFIRLVPPIFNVKPWDLSSILRDVTARPCELRKKLVFSTVIWTHFFGLFSPLLPHRSKPSCAQRGTLL